MGVATLPSAPRQGLGAAATTRLVEDALSRGPPTVFHSASSWTWLASTPASTSSASAPALKAPNLGLLGQRVRPSSHRPPHLARLDA
jgi:hypothetical protein